MSVKWIGWVGIFHVLFIVGWIVYNLSHHLIYPAPLLGEDQSLAELGILYYSEHRGLLGFDHGSKSLMMLLSIVLPVGIFYILKRDSAFDLLNMLALVAGVVGFTLYSLSLMLQAVTVEYAFQLFINNNDASAQAFCDIDL
ncbi:hypothetical protein RYX56_16575 [Alkalihalophilus lindianensis]|uniref:Uncharacterized protein n=1 Tax=Alkalihalophilus lindianensis TaxID=1630542 RepID=A0ABU3XDM3_9BACI|nr:hypothetical protein [Alkalihalophilus lindianensis]MDV2685984.1 hypothetical protein [Alkalihalophilus lindianensis]